MASRKVVVYGGKGGLGSACVAYLKKLNYWVCSIDLRENLAADCNVLVGKSESLSTQQSHIDSQIGSALGGEKLDAILCVAGGWAGGNAAHQDFFKNAEFMWKNSVWSSSIAAVMATSYLAAGGFLVFCGAQAALGGTPGMIGYGMAKAAVHQLTRSMACKGSGLPEDAVVTAILPVTLDTPMNRKWMPNADHSTWTPLDTIAKQLADWIEGNSRPSSGSLIQLITKDGKTEFKPVLALDGLPL
ncbi:unnamed protein product [Calicophoron daubneyi]|uniref:Dihydropteridine reductase n=1 Tax=Calicophoron daubneyi TaxID=300641 RepID=A0AAV2TX86_CALDB